MGSKLTRIAYFKATLFEEAVSVDFGLDGGCEVLHGGAEDGGGLWRGGEGV